jgi:cytochrome c oxidase subunit 2
MSIPEAAMLQLAAPLQGHGWGMPHDASLNGWRIDALIDETSFFVIALFVIMVSWMLWAVFKHDRRHTAQFDHGTSRRSIAVSLGIAAAVFFVVDGHLFLNSVLAWRDVFGNFAWAESQPETVRIEVNAHQWSWAVRYAGPDGKFNTPDDIVLLNEIVVPQGAPVTFQLVSTDVIHSFNVPNMRAKIDVVPGMVNRVWFTPKETGEFDIACAQHCGANHYKMKAKVTVLPRADYERWAAEASANSARAFDPDDKDGHWGWEWAEHSRI